MKFGIHRKSATSIRQPSADYTKYKNFEVDATCPTCRSTYQKDQLVACPQCYPETVREALPRILSKFQVVSAAFANRSSVPVNGRVAVAAGAGATAAINTTTTSSANVCHIANFALPPPPRSTKPRVQRARKHSPNGSIINRETSSTPSSSPPSTNGLSPPSLPLQPQPSTNSFAAATNAFRASSTAAATVAVFASWPDTKTGREKSAKKDHDDALPQPEAAARQQVVVVSAANVATAADAVAVAHSSPFIIPRIPPPTSVYTLAKADEMLNNSFYGSPADLDAISRSQRHLRASGWYHAALTMDEANALLMHTAVGTFLMRDSSNFNYLYSLSVQTKIGPYSLRIRYARGHFQLDGDRRDLRRLPAFPCIMRLVQHYADATVRQPLSSKPADGRDGDNVDPAEVAANDENLPRNGAATATIPVAVADRDSLMVSPPIVLKKPKYLAGHVPSLKHLSRLCIHRHLKDPNFLSVLPVSEDVVKYLLEYPYKF